MLVIAAVTGTATAGAVTVPNYSFQANVVGDGGQFGYGTGLPASG